MQQAPHPSRGAGPATLYRYNIREIIGEGLQALLGLFTIITLIGRGVRTHRLVGIITKETTNIIVSPPPIPGIIDTTLKGIIAVEAI